MNQELDLSVVIPVYRCAGSLRQLHLRLTNVLRTMNVSYEVIFVNDSSPDGSWDIICSLCEGDTSLKGIHLSRNFGQHYAITAGLDYSSGKWVVVMDGDLQDRPEEIPNLIRATENGFEIVTASRKLRKDTLSKRAGSAFFYHIFSYLTDTKQDPSVANFGVYHRSVISSLIRMPESLRYFPILIKWLGFRATSIEVSHSEREIGKSSYNLRKLVGLALDVIISFSDKPLRLTVRFGLLLSLLSLAYALYIAIHALTGHTAIAGWSSLIVSLWFLSGLILMTLGIVGVYINKIFDQVKGRPLYIESEIIGFDNDQIEYRGFRK